MKIFRQQKWVGGWFVGDFEPSAFNTSAFEVCHKQHPKGERWPKHFHKVATEINYVLSGTMTLQGNEFKPGDVFILEPGEVADPEFLTDVELIVIKSPSVKNDKYKV